MKRKMIVISSLLLGLLVLIFVAIRLTSKGSGGLEFEDTGFDTIADEKLEKFITEQTQEVKGDKAREEKLQLLEQFVEGSGVQEDFSKLDKMIDFQIDAISKAQLPEEEKNIYIESIKKIFDPSTMYDVYLSNLNNQFSSQELQDLVEVYSNPLVEKSVKEMQNINSDEGQKDFVAFLKDIKDHPLSEKRHEQLVALNEITKISENAFSVMSETMTIMWDAIEANRATVPTEAQKNRAAEEKKNYLEFMKVNTEQLTLMSMAKAHDGMSDQELDEITKLRGRPVAVKENKVRNDVMRTFLSQKKARQGFGDMMKIR